MTDRTSAEDVRGEDPLEPEAVRGDPEYEPPYEPMSEADSGVTAAGETRLEQEEPDDVP